jgi:hypothetical protein
VERQPVHIHPSIKEWVRGIDDRMIGVGRSFEQACKALSEVDLNTCPAVTPFDQCKLYNYLPAKEVPGAFRIILMFDVQGPYVNILSVGIPALKLRHDAPAVR